MAEYIVCLVVETHYHVKVEADSYAEAIAKTDDLEALRDNPPPDDVNWYASWAQCGIFGERIDADDIERDAQTVAK